MSSQDSFKFQCPDCSVSYKTVVANVGKRFRCKKCGHKFVVERPPAEIEVEASDFDFETADIESIIERTKAAEAEANSGTLLGESHAPPSPDQPAPPRQLEQRRKATEGQKPPKRIFSKPTNSSGQKKNDDKSAAESVTNEAENKMSMANELSPGPLPNVSGEAFDDNATGDDSNDNEALSLADSSEDIEEQIEEEEDLSPLHIEGLTNDSVDVDDLYGVKCQICDTRIHVTDDQIGSEVECPICYTKVKVVPPRSKPDQRPTWMSPEDYYEQEEDEEDSNEELTLSAPVELPESSKIDATTYTLETLEEDVPVVEPVESDDDDENSSELTMPNSAPNKNTKENQSGPENDELRLAPAEALDDISEDDLKPESPAPALKHVKHSKQEAAESDDEGTVEAPPVVAGKRRRPRNNSLPQSSVETRTAKSEGMSRRERLESALEDEEEPTEPISVHESEDLEPLSLSSLMSHARSMFTSPVLWVCLAAAAVLMTFGDVLYDTFIGLQGDERERGLGHAFKLILFGLGFVGLHLAGTAILWYACSVIFRESARGKDKVPTWKMQGSNEFTSTILLFGFSCFLAGSFFLPLGISVSAPLRMLIAPIPLLLAWYSQNPFIGTDFTPLKSLSSQGPNWQTFYLFVFVLAVITCVGGVFFMVPYCSIIGAIIICLTTVVFAAVTGWHVGRTVQLMEVE